MIRKPRISSGAYHSTLDIDVTIGVVKFLLSCVIIPCGRNVIILLVIFIFVFFISLRRNLVGTTRLLHHPVEYIVVLIPALVKQIFEKFPQISYVWLLLEFHRPAVIQIVADFLR